jgi:hypothetical protein
VRASDIGNLDDLPVVLGCQLGAPLHRKLGRTETLDRLDGEERNRIYRMLRLEITPREDGALDVRGILGDGLGTRHEEGSAADDFVLLISAEITKRSW